MFFVFSIWYDISHFISNRWIDKRQVLNTLVDSSFFTFYNAVSSTDSVTILNYAQAKYKDIIDFTL
jgi:hypothetical protein